MPGTAMEALLSREGVAARQEDHRAQAPRSASTTGPLAGVGSRLNQSSDVARLAQLQRKLNGRSESRSLAMQRMEAPAAAASASSSTGSLEGGHEESLSSAGVHVEVMQCSGKGPIAGAKRRREASDSESEGGESDSDMEDGEAESESDSEEEEAGSESDMEDREAGSELDSEEEEAGSESDMEDGEGGQEDDEEEQGVEEEGGSDLDGSEEDDEDDSGSEEESNSDDSDYEEPVAGGHPRFNFNMGTKQAVIRRTAHRRTHRNPAYQDVWTCPACRRPLAYQQNGNFQLARFNYTSRKGNKKSEVAPQMDHYPPWARRHNNLVAQGATSDQIRTDHDDLTRLRALCRPCNGSHDYESDEVADYSSGSDESGYATPSSEPDNAGNYSKFKPPPPPPPPPGPADGILV